MFSYKKFAHLCTDRDIKPSVVAALIGKTSAAATGWKNGKQPRPATIVKIAEVLKCSVEDLLEDEESTSPSSDALSDAKAELIGIIPDLPDEVVSLLLAGAKEWLSKHTPPGVLE